LSRSSGAGRTREHSYVGTIDGDHEYEGVLADFNAYLPLVRPGGLIAFHDIVPDEFARTGHRTAGSQCYGGGVYKLWHELAARFEHREFVQSWDQNGFGIGVITKPDQLALPEVPLEHRGLVT